MSDQQPIHRHVTPHARTRALERYGVQPTDEQWRDAWLAITATVLHERAPAILTRRDPTGQEHWLVTVGGVAMNLLYRPDTAVITSVLPRVHRVLRRDR